MARERTILIASGAVASLVVAGLLLAPRVSEELAPKPQQAWVAIQPAGSAVARVGPVEVPAGTAFTLHAVLEARDRDGQRVYYTAAPSLEIGGEAVPAAALRRWDRPEEARVLWFTVEGKSPYLPLEAPGDLQRFEVNELFRPDWPQTWSVPGALEPRHDDHLARARAQKDRPFGTQRYHARIELFDRDSPTLPQTRFKSWGAAELPERWEEFPAVVATLPGVAGPPSRVFGLTQIQPPEAASRELLAEVADLARRRLAFSLATVLRETLEAAGADGMGSLQWREVELARSGLRWDADVRQGDLLRSGAQVAVLHRDAGVAGQLDAGDLALAFEMGALVLPLGEVFTSGLPVELAPLRSP